MNTLKHAVKKSSPLASRPVLVPPKSTKIPGPRYRNLPGSYLIRRIVGYAIFHAPALPPRDRPRINPAGKPSWLPRPSNIHDSYPKRLCYTNPPRPALHLEKIDLQWGKWRGVFAKPSKIPRRCGYNPVCANGSKPTPGPTAYQKWLCEAAFRGVPLKTRLNSWASAAFSEALAGYHKRAPWVMGEKGWGEGGDLKKIGVRSV
ncbi:hypothetical protein RUND412_001119 [Rhizina undulata]